MYATKQSSIEYENCPAGMHRAVCYRVIDLGTQFSSGKWGDKHQRKVLISWELPNTLMQPYKDNDGVEHPARPFTIHKRYTLSFSDKANLLKDLNSWRGRPFTEAELAGPPNGFYMQNIIGANCFLNVVHDDSGEKTYVNIAAIAPLEKGMEKKEPTNPPLFLDLMQFDSGVFKELSQNLQDTIAKSPEYVEATGGAGMQADRQDSLQSNIDGMPPTPPMESYENQPQF